MFRRYLPVIAVLFSVLLDTAVIPMLYHGFYLIPISLIVVMAIGVLIGRMRGMLYGLIAGLVLDISAGSLGNSLFAYLIIGYLIGFFLDAQAVQASGRENEEHAGSLLPFIVWTLIFTVLYEAGILVYQYISNAVFEWIFVRNLIIRALLCTALSLALLPFHRMLFVGNEHRVHANRNRREVKHF